MSYIAHQKGCHMILLPSFLYFPFPLHTHANIDIHVFISHSKLLEVRTPLLVQNENYTEKETKKKRVFLIGGSWGEIAMKRQL